jgi:hypothetical protein
VTMRIMAVAATVGVLAVQGSSEGADSTLVPPTTVVPACGTYQVLSTMLGDRFGERPASTGLADDGKLVQLFASPAAETWTMVTIEPDGRTCVVSTGRHWQAKAVPADGRAA